MILKAKDEKKTSFELEFKYVKEGNAEDKLDQLANQAILQIISNKYDQGLKGKVIYMGLAHYGKDVVVKWQNK